MPYGHHAHHAAVAELLVHQGRVEPVGLLRLVRLDAPQELNVGGGQLRDEVLQVSPELGRYGDLLDGMPPFAQTRGPRRRIDAADILNGLVLEGLDHVEVPDERALGAAHHLRQIRLEPVAVGADESSHAVNDVSREVFDGEAVRPHRHAAPRAPGRPPGGRAARDEPGVGVLVRLVEQVQQRQVVRGGLVQEAELVDELEYALVALHQGYAVHAALVLDPVHGDALLNQTSDLRLEYLRVEHRLDLFVAEVDAQLLEPIDAEHFEPEYVEHADVLHVVMRAAVLHDCVTRVDQPREQPIVQFLGESRGVS